LFYISCYILHKEQKQPLNLAGNTGAAMNFFVFTSTGLLHRHYILVSEKLAQNYSIFCKTQKFQQKSLSLHY